MLECDTCGRGFQFPSQLTEHRRIHQVIGDWVCFKPGCGKRFKRESELDAHLYSHQTAKLKCDQCTYENADPHNLRAHKRKHSDKKVLSVKIVVQPLRGCSNNADTSKITSALDGKLISKR